MLKNAEAREVSEAMCRLGKVFFVRAHSGPVSYIKVAARFQLIAASSYTSSRRVARIRSVELLQDRVFDL
jgi:hypothetical protein